MRSITRSMWPGWLVFSTSKKIAWRVVGRDRACAGGGTRAAKSGSGVSTATRGPPPAGADGVSTATASTAGAGRALGAARRGRRLAFFRSMPRIIRDRHSPDQEVRAAGRRGAGAPPAEARLRIYIGRDTGSARVRDGD